MASGLLTDSIPIEAWQQAAIVALFACIFLPFMLYILNWTSKHEKSWQEFIAKSDEKWRQWLTEQNAREADSMEKVAASLDKLSQKVDETKEEIRAHDDNVETRIRDAIKEVRPTTRPRK